MTQEQETVTITRRLYDRLLDSDKILKCLQEGGVDNWDGYSESLRQFGYFGEDEDEEDDQIYYIGNVRQSD